MSSYYKALERIARAEDEPRSAAEARHRLQPHPRSAGAVVALPAARELPLEIARMGALKRLAERLAPVAALENQVRVAIVGCRRGDGASSVTTALAVDLSQRLALRVAVVDAHLLHPALHRFFTPGDEPSPIVLNSLAQVRATAWPGLDLLSCCPPNSPEERQRLLDELETLLSRYAAAIIDLGVTRLDPRMLPLVRRSDPTLLVVRYGHTERAELASTVAALREAGRPAAGVVLNAARGPKPYLVRRLLGR